MKYRDTRRVTEFPAVLLAGTISRTVEIREVSRTGLKISGLTGDLTEQTGEAGSVILDILSHRVRCRIRWQKGDRAGLELAMPLPRILAEKVQRRFSRTGGGHPLHAAR